MNTTGIIIIVIAVVLVLIAVGLLLYFLVFAKKGDSGGGDGEDKCGIDSTGKEGCCGKDEIGKYPICCNNRCALPGDTCLCDEEECNANPKCSYSSSAGCRCCSSTQIGKPSEGCIDSGGVVGCVAPIANKCYVLQNVVSKKYMVWRNSQQVSVDTIYGKAIEERNYATVADCNLYTSSNKDVTSVVAFDVYDKDACKYIIRLGQLPWSCYRANTEGQNGSISLNYFGIDGVADSNAVFKIQGNDNSGYQIEDKDGRVLTTVNNAEETESQVFFYSDKTSALTYWKLIPNETVYVASYPKIPTSAKSKIVRIQSKENGKFWLWGKEIIGGNYAEGSKNYTYFKIIFQTAVDGKVVPISTGVVRPIFLIESVYEAGLYASADKDLPNYSTPSTVGNVRVYLDDITDTRFTRNVSFGYVKSLDAWNVVFTATKVNATSDDAKLVYFALESNYNGRGPADVLHTDGKILETNQKTNQLTWKLLSANASSYPVEPL